MESVVWKHFEPEGYKVLYIPHYGRSNRKPGYERFRDAFKKLDQTVADAKEEARRSN